MAPTKSTKVNRSKKKAPPELTEVEQREILERTNQIQERFAETQLDLAKLFLNNQKLDIARRRLEEIVAGQSGSAAAKEAKRLLKNL